jgi:hypothetical protein
MLTAYSNPGAIFWVPLPTTPCSTPAALRDAAPGRTLVAVGPSLRFLRGEVLEALKRPAEALLWYEASANDYGGEFYVAAITRAHKRLNGSR